MSITPFMMISWLFDISLLARWRDVWLQRQEYGV
jgi:hypothetical protein